MTKFVTLVSSDRDSLYDAVHALRAKRMITLAGDVFDADGEHWVCAVAPIASNDAISRFLMRKFFDVKLA